MSIQESLFHLFNTTGRTTCNRRGRGGTAKKRNNDFGNQASSMLKGLGDTLVFVKFRFFWFLGLVTLCSQGTGYVVILQKSVACVCVYEYLSRILKKLLRTHPQTAPLPHAPPFLFFPCVVGSALMVPEFPSPRVARFERKKRMTRQHKWFLFLFFSVMIK